MFFTGKKRDKVRHNFAERIRQFTIFLFLVFPSSFCHLIQYSLVNFTYQKLSILNPCLLYGISYETLCLWKIPFVGGIPDLTFIFGTPYLDFASQLQICYITQRAVSLGFLLLNLRLVSISACQRSHFSSKASTLLVKRKMKQYHWSNLTQRL